MAIETSIEDRSPNLVIFELNRKEAVDIIGLLSAQVAGVALTGNVSGSPATFNVVDRGHVLRRYIFTVKSENEQPSEENT